MLQKYLILNSFLLKEFETFMLALLNKKKDIVNTFLSLYQLLKGYVKKMKIFFSLC